MSVPLDFILAFIQVVRRGSFTAASSAMGLSKSLISKQVSALEKHLKAQLMTRTTRRLVLTEVGKIFYEHVKDLPATIAQAENAIEPFHTVPYGVLKVVAPQGMEHSLKEQVIPHYLSQYPQVSIHIDFVSDVDKYFGDDYDVIIAWKLTEEDFSDYSHNLVAHPLFQMPIGLYATPTYLQQHGIPEVPADLDQHNCFSFSGPEWPFKEEAGDVFYQAVSGSLDSNAHSLIYAAVMNHLGVTYAYPFLFQEALLAGTVVQVLEQYTSLKVEVQAFRYPTPYLPTKIRVFIDEIRSYYRGIQQDILQRGKS